MTGKPIDISRTIEPGALVYPGDPPLEARPLCRIGPDSAFNLLELRWTTHFLTHLDAPLHFFEGAPSVAEIPPERLISEALVIGVDGPAVLPGHIPAAAAGLALLFRTRHSADWDPRAYDRDHVYISAAAAQCMVERGVRLAGVDYLSVDRFGDEDYPVHRILLGHGVLILEGLDLRSAPPGRYTLIALPLKIAAGDGSPVRAVLLPR
ncbi:MAG TPA: cyclase family protein [Bryobacteraceae bacterium]|nr:cyclase family protein [Bryobacteraceae bacterium]